MLQNERNSTVGQCPRSALLLPMMVVVVAIICSCSGPPPKPSKSIHEAVRNDARDLYCHFYHRSNLEEPDEDGDRPIHIAASLSMSTTIEKLLKHGAKVESRNRKGFTALHVVAYKDYPDVARLLLANGAKLDTKELTKGMTPREVAVYMRSEKVAKLLADAEAEEKRKR